MFRTHAECVCRILKNLLRLANPEYAKLLEGYVHHWTDKDTPIEVVVYRVSPLPYYALSNLLTLFSHDVPTLPLIQHIFDYLLCRPPIAVVYLTAAVRGEFKWHSLFVWIIDP